MNKDDYHCPIPMEWNEYISVIASKKAKAASWRTNRLFLLFSGRDTTGRDFWNFFPDLVDSFEFLF